jgi:hypothetical protein
MPAIIAVKVVADGAYFGGAMQRPVIGGAGMTVEREPAGRIDVDEIVGDRPALRVGQEMTLQIGTAKNNQKAERQRQPDQLDRPLWR